MSNLNNKIIVTADDRMFTVPESTPPGLYRLMLIPVNTSGDGYRKFYRSQVVPYMNNSLIDVMADFETECNTHETLKAVCNGGRSTAKMSKAEWKAYLMRIQGFAICRLDCGWPF